jgi:LysR family glycine cleavage system transcriptional activator
MAERLPSLNALRAFEAVARHLSLTRAAAELHVTPAAVSHQIKALEQDLGVSLLRRVKREFLLTDAAKAGLPDLREGFDRIAQSARKMREDDAAGLLTVSLTPSFAANWLVPRIDRFKETEPDIDLRLDTSTGLADFVRGNVDVAIRYGTGDYPGLRVVPLFEEQIFPVCSPELLEGPHPLREPADLKLHTLLHLDWTPQKGEWPDWRMWLLAAGVRGVDVTRGPRFSDFSLALNAAVRGQGVALGSSALVADDLAAGRLAWPFQLCVPTTFACYFVCPEDSAERPKVAAFRDWLLAEAAQTRASFGGQPE